MGSNWRSMKRKEKREKWSNGEVEEQQVMILTFPKYWFDKELCFCQLFTFINNYGSWTKLDLGTEFRQEVFWL